MEYLSAKKETKRLEIKDLEIKDVGTSNFWCLSSPRMSTLRKI